MALRFFIWDQQRFTKISLDWSFFIILGGLIRFDGMLFAIALLAIPVALALTKKVFRKRGIAKLLAPVFVLIAGIALVSQTQAVCRTQAECKAWNTYTSFNEIRGTFHGTPRMQLILKDLESTSWSINDYKLFRNFIYIDDETFNLNNLEHIDDVVPSPSIVQALITNPFAPIQKVFSSNSEISLIFYTAFLAFVYFFFRSTGRNSPNTASLVLGLASWLLATGAAATMRFPVRIHEPALVSFAIFLLISSAVAVGDSVSVRTRPVLRNTRRDLTIFSTLLLILMCSLVLFMNKYSTQNAVRISRKISTVIIF